MNISVSISILCVALSFFSFLGRAGGEESFNQSSHHRSIFLLKELIVEAEDLNDTKKKINHCDQIINHSKKIVANPHSTKNQINEALNQWSKAALWKDGYEPKSDSYIKDDHLIAQEKSIKNKISKLLLFLVLSF